MLKITIENGLDAVRQWMADHTGITVTLLAKKAGMHREHVSRILNHPEKDSRVQIGTVRKLIAAVNDLAGSGGRQ